MINKLCLLSFSIFFSSCFVIKISSPPGKEVYLFERSEYIALKEGRVEDSYLYAKPLFPDLTVEEIKESYKVYLIKKAGWMWFAVWGLASINEGLPKELISDCKRVGISVSQDLVTGLVSVFTSVTSFVPLLIEVECLMVEKR